MNTFSLNIDYLSAFKKWNTFKEENREFSSQPYTNIYQKKSDKNNTIVIQDEIKTKHLCFISVIDFSQNIDSYNCWWCHNRCSYEHLYCGCPIAFENDQIIKKYKSYISQELYTIKENVFSFQLKNAPCNDESTEMIYNEKNYYITKGIFCSFNCCLAFVKYNQRDEYYNQSYFLLNQMYQSMTGNDLKKLIPAPHWETLKEYGGFLSIEKFRESFTKMQIIKQGEIKDLKYLSVGTLLEEKLIFQ